MFFASRVGRCWIARGELGGAGLERRQMQAQTPGRGTWSGRIRQLGKGTEKEHAGEGDRKHDWEEESEKASWRRGHPSFLLKDEGIWAPE